MERTYLTKHNSLDLFSNVKILNGSGVGFFKAYGNLSEPVSCLNNDNLPHCTRLRKVYADNDQSEKSSII